MKKIVFLFVLSVFMSVGAFAQIKVDSSGNVGINNTSPGHKLDINGTVHIWAPGSLYGGLVFDNTGYGNPTTLRPIDDWYGCLGRSDKRFNLLYVDHVIARDLEETSDERVKENIVTLDNSLSKIVKLRGVKYDLKADYFNVSDSKTKSKLEEEGKNEIGFLAQELMEVFPEVVFLDSTSNLYSISYTRLVPVLVEAIKEQQAQIDELKKLVSK